MPLIISNKQVEVEHDGPLHILIPDRKYITRHMIILMGINRKFPYIVLKVSINIIDPYRLGNPYKYLKYIYIYIYI